VIKTLTATTENIAVIYTTKETTKQRKTSIE